MLSYLVLQLWNCWFQVTTGVRQEDCDSGPVFTGAGLQVEEELMLK